MSSLNLLLVQSYFNLIQNKEKNVQIARLLRKLALY